MSVSADGLNGFFLLLLYTTVGGIAYRWLIPRLTLNAKILAGLMLAAQILVIVLSQTVEIPSSFDARLWELRHEWNIPSTLAATQLATVGAVAVLLGWLARGKSDWHRIYFVVLGLLFLFLSVDEYFKVHEPIQNWFIVYAAAGAIVALVTVVVAVRSPASVRFWFAWLISGLGIGAMGAILFERLNRLCDGLLFLQFEGCFHFYVWEEAAEFAGIWLALVAVLGLFSELRPPPSRAMRRILLGLPLFWLLLLFANAMLPRLELRLFARAASVEFEDGMRLIGYRLDDSSADKGWISLRLYLSSAQKHTLWQGYSIHIVDQSNGKSVASNNAWVDRQHSIWLFGAEFEQIYRQMMDVAITPGTPVNHAYWILLTLWHPRGEGYAEEKARSSDHRLLSETQVLLGEIVLRQAPDTVLDTNPLARFENGFALRAVELPAQARAGETKTLKFDWSADAPSTEDLLQFLHLGHEASGAWLVFDQQPLGARLPSRLWYNGLADSELWRVSLPASLAPGRYNIFTGLYRIRDKERLSVNDEFGKPFLDHRVPLGSLIVTSA